MFAAAAPSFLSRALQLISGVRQTDQHSRGAKMPETAPPTWIVDVDEDVAQYPTTAELLTALSAIAAQPEGHVAVRMDRGPAKGWLRFLGGAKRDVSPCFHLEW